jgi:hypothetical protein
MIAELKGIEIKIKNKYALSAPQGVKFRTNF